MYTTNLYTLTVLFLALPSLVWPLPVRRPNDSVIPNAKDGSSRRSIVLPLDRPKVSKRYVEELLVGSVGLGDFADMVYTVAIQVGNTTTAVNLDTGSSDLWIMSQACQTSVCQKSNSTAYSTSTFQAIGASVNLTYGDTTSGTFAAGPIGMDTVTLAGLTLSDQPFAAINDTDNTAVLNGGAGIIGLGFPSESSIETQVTSKEFDNPTATDDFISHIGTYGPFVSRLVTSGVIDQPLFAITLQRDTIDVSGTGEITIGELPSGVDNSSITWVPVRLYLPSEGGLNPPSFASSEVYPLRWEVPIDNVYLDGKQLANSTIQPNGVPNSFVSALIDSGNSLIRGPQDVVDNILSSVSPAYAANSAAKATLPCTDEHTLAFEIGGKMFPVDPSDFITQNQTGNATTCVASSVVSTDPPSFGSLFSWSLGDPFLKSNMVVFYYGNLTNPSEDPPRIGFLSMVPANASSELSEAVTVASKNQGVFSSKIDVAPTSSTVIDIPVSSTTSLPMPSHSITAIDRMSNQQVSSTSVSRSQYLGGFSLGIVSVLCMLSSCVIY